MQIKNIVIAALITLFAFNANANLLNDLYSNLSGFNIPSEEYKKIQNAGGAPTYGEITYESVNKLLKKFDLTKKDVFYDLGCGIGKMVVQIYLNSPAKKCVGIELSKTRYDEAKKVQEALKNKHLLKKKQKLIFQEKDILKANLSDATVVYMGSTCFSHELMEKLMKKLAKLKKGLRVATLQPFPENNDFTLIETMQLPMSWSNHSSVYLYELKQTK